MHDPYGLTNAEELRWLIQAVDELVEELHVKPQKWAGMATDGRKATRSEWGATTFPNGEQLLTA